MNKSAQSIGEAVITPHIVSSVAPDTVSPAGKAELFHKLGSATLKKPELDDVLQTLAKKIGAKFSSRIKNPQTTVQKIAQKRLQGRDYNIEDINDPYGARLIVDDKADIGRAKSGIKELADKGFLKILKAQPVKNDTYSAYHMDIQTPEGVKGELQIMTPQEHLESVSNHGLRAVYGEKQPGKVQALREKQAKIAQSTPKNTAIQLAQRIQNLSQSPTGQPPDPRVVASILQKA